MSPLLDKSNCNMKVAESLARNDELCPVSVHCSYYACFQLIKHLLAFVIQPSYVLPQKNAHVKAREKMMDALAQTDRNLAFTFNNDFLSLYVFRIDSDYENIQITVPNAVDAAKLAFKIRECLTMKFTP
jgi:hypothetical protein